MSTAYLALAIACLAPRPEKLLARRTPTAGDATSGTDLDEATM